MNKKNRIIQLESKLAVLRNRWREASPVMKQIVESQAFSINREIVILERLIRKNGEKIDNSRPKLPLDK